MTISIKAICGRCIIPVAVTLLLIGVVFHFRAVLPFGDGFVYMSCIFNAVSSMQFADLACHGHPMQAYGLLHGIPLAAGFFSPLTFFVVNALLLLVASMCFRRSLSILFPSVAPSSCDLMAAIYALSPLAVSSIFYVNLDFPLYAGAAIFLYGLLSSRIILAACACIFLVFSKETGLAVYMLLSGLYLLLFITRCSRSRKELGAGLKSMLPLLIPGLLFAVYVVYRVIFSSPDSLLWKGRDVAKFDHITHLLFNLDPMHRTVSQLSGFAFILNFRWLLTFIMSVWLLAYIMLWVFNHPTRERLLESVVDQRWGKFLWIATLLLMLLVTRPLGAGAMPRYVLPALPVFYLTAFLCASSIFRSKTLLNIYLSVALVLVFASNFVTLDPISRHLFGELNVGTSVMLQPSAANRKRVQLNAMVYNLQSIALDRIFLRVVRQVHAKPRGRIFNPDGMYYFSTHKLLSGERVMIRPAADVIPRVRMTRSDSWLKAAKVCSPAMVYYVLYPWSRLVSARMDLLSAHYDMQAVERVHTGSFEARVLTFVNKHTDCVDQ